MTTNTGHSFYFFLPDVLGGVNNVLNNIISYSDGDRKIKMVGYRSSDEKRAAMEFPRKNVSAKERFLFDPRDNLFHTFKNLRKKITDSNPSLIATDSLELQMIQFTSLDVKTIFIVLGDFDHYYELASSFKNIIDGYIAISQEIYLKLVELLPDKKEVIHLAYFPTPPVHVSRNNYSAGRLRIIFVGRLEEGKNPLLLSAIDDELNKHGVNVEWTIVGDGPVSGQLKELIKNKNNFFLKGFVTNEQLHELYKEQDVFIMPSEYEGLPVSLIEAMKTGLVPVVSDIPGGMREIVKSGKNGFLCKLNNVDEFASRLQDLYKQPSLISEYSALAKKTVEQQFDAIVNSKKYFEIIDNTPYKKGTKKFGGKLNTLDKPWLPNFLVKWVRTIKK